MAINKELNTIHIKKIDFDSVTKLEYFINNLGFSSKDELDVKEEILLNLNSLQYLWTPGGTIEKLNTKIDLLYKIAPSSFSLMKILIESDDIKIDGNLSIEDVKLIVLESNLWKLFVDSNTSTPNLISYILGVETILVRGGNKNG